MQWPWQKQKVSRETIKGPALACMHTGICSKHLCPLWVKFDSTVIVEGKQQVIQESACSIAWTPRLLIELRNHVVLALKPKDAT